MSLREITNYLVDIVLGKKIYTCNYCGTKWKSLPSSMDSPERNDRTCSMSCFIDHNRDFFGLPPLQDDFEIIDSGEIENGRLSD